MKTTVYSGIEIISLSRIKTKKFTHTAIETLTFHLPQSEQTF